jgi:hypothetical protein
MTCDCLTQYDSTLVHYVSCPAYSAENDGQDTPARALAECAAYRDIDLALYCLRQLEPAKTVSSFTQGSFEMSDNSAVLAELVDARDAIQRAYLYARSGQTADLIEAILVARDYANAAIEVAS